MRVDFYQLTRDPAEFVLPLIARAAMGAGARLLVVSSDEAQLARIDEALWTRLPESFLAHGFAGGRDDARQPILLSSEPVPANGARFMACADGHFREMEGMERAFLLFPPAQIDDARGTWRTLRARAGADLRYWRQGERGWEEVKPGG
ncbi:DNA polymerase III subunit chi [Novosphingobium huizhouense]|uniref:DNA polymerase III subunit chi n=1 Tax=Novosphingobium huizhouense TaxID=2866625 RepID=UPI001CD9109F|nr:DNA polymerase III subunit chi [Novosphingobium huizhouense]